MIVMAVNMLLGLVIPAVLYFIVKKRFGENRIVFFTGCGIIFVFAFVLESLVHSLVLGGSMGSVISGNIWIYGLYGAAMAAIFEESGRLAACNCQCILCKKCVEKICEIGYRVPNR